MRRRAAERRDRLAQTAEHIVEGQQGAAPELDNDRLFGFGQVGAAGPGWPYRGVICGGALTPFGHRLDHAPWRGVAALISG
jgi:hypothetical protein